MTKPQSPANHGWTARFFDRPILILVLTTAFWGGNTVAGKLAVGHVDPFSLTILRWAGALVSVLPFAMGPLRDDLRTIRRSWLLLLMYGALGYCTFNILMYLAAYQTSGVNASIEQVVINILVMLGNFALFKLKVKPLQILGVVLTIFGVAITATHGQLDRLLALDINAGDGLVMLACLAYAIYSLTLRYRPQMNWLSFLVVTFCGALLAALVYQITIGGGFGGFISSIPTITPRGWLIVLYVLTFPSILAQMFYVRGVELIGSNRASLFINLIPVFGTVGSVLILGERLEGFHLIAGGLIIAGIILAEWSARRTT
jgi:drug/metabolite transporter (DMT)-like permease